MAYYILKSYKLKLSPWAIFAALKDEANCFFLDSSLDASSLSRYSFLGINPFYILKAQNSNPFLKLRELMDKYRVNIAKLGIPLLGGAIGYLSYDLGLILEEKLSLANKKKWGIPDCFFAFYNTIVIIDHLQNTLHVFCIGFPETKHYLVKSVCENNFKHICRLLSAAENKKSIQCTAPDYSVAGTLRSNFSKASYINAVKKAQDYIAKGDIYQVNLSQQFSAESSLSAFDIYRRLRLISPSSFSAYFDAGDFQILSSSPERFLKLDHSRRVSTRPMKGTRARSRNTIEDKQLKQALWNSPKDKAELIMIVDLLRNDLGRVCSYDSIKVTRLRELEVYNTVYQTTATVEGKLHSGKDRIDLLRACFPGGSITGCPKIRSMEIIEELEPSRRGIYTGALGYLSFSGNLDFNILIRTILKQQERLTFASGGGIVADSKPQDEYQETLVKAQAMLQAISGCHSDNRQPSETPFFANRGNVYTIEEALV